MYKINNFTSNDDMEVTKSLGAFSVIEYIRDLSVTSSNAMSAYYSSQMNVLKVDGNYAIV